VASCNNEARAFHPAGIDNMIVRECQTRALNRFYVMHLRVIILGQEEALSDDSGNGSMVLCAN
jgi:hypothetical protein